MRYLAGFLLLLAIAASSCGGAREEHEDDDGDHNIGFDTGAISVTVTNPATTPQFSWTGPVKSIKVWAAGSTVSRWSVDCSAASTDCIAPPVNYGDTMAGTTVNIAPGALSTGTTYYVQVDRIGGSYGIQPFDH